MTAEDVRVVVVDDDVDTCDALKILLELDGYNVRTALDAEQAMAAVEAHRPVCVLLDLGLPGIDGIELARRIRATYGGDLVLVALTGWTGDDDRDAAEAAGVDYVMHKPLDVERLRLVLPPVV